MSNKKKDKTSINNIMNIKVNREDVTKYGEFVPSYFEWISLDKQKQKAKDLNNITKK